MKLNRILFYILLALFVAAVCIVAFTDAGSVWSRVGIGLMTGSLIGLINAFVNYMHARSEYFARFAMLCWNVETKLQEYQLEAHVYNSIMAEKTRKEMIEYTKEFRENEEAELEEMKRAFKRFGIECKGDQYVPLFFWNTYYRSFEKICDKIVGQFHLMQSLRRSSRVFEFLDSRLSKDEENIVTGSADDFEQTLRKSCVDYHDLIVYERVELSKLITVLCNKTFCRTNSKSTAAILLSAADCPMITFGGDKVRDVRKERLEEIRNMYYFEENGE